MLICKRFDNIAILLTLLNYLEIPDNTFKISCSFVLLPSKSPEILTNIWRSIPPKDLTTDQC